MKYAAYYKTTNQYILFTDTTIQEEFTKVLRRYLDYVDYLEKVMDKEDEVYKEFQSQSTIEKFSDYYYNSYNYTLVILRDTDEDNVWSVTNILPDTILEYGKPFVRHPTNRFLQRAKQKQTKRVRFRPKTRNNRSSYRRKDVSINKYYVSPKYYQDEFLENDIRVNLVKFHSELKFPSFRVVQSDKGGWKQATKYHHQWQHQRPKKKVIKT